MVLMKSFTATARVDLAAYWLYVRKYVRMCGFPSFIETFSVTNFWRNSLYMLQTNSIDL